MGLYKQIVLDSGVILNYHRIVSVNNITNISSIVEIASYTSKEKRQEEKEILEYNQNNVDKKDMNIFIHSMYLNKEYEKELNVDSAYNYIKTLEMFENSVDDV